MARTYTETVGMITSFIAYLNDAQNVAALTAKGLDVPATKTRLQNKLDLFNQLNVDQEQLKVAQVDKTKELVAEVAAADMDTSGMIDAAAGLLGKTTTAGKSVLAIRSDIRSGPNPTPTPPPPTP